MHPIDFPAKFDQSSQTPKLSKTRLANHSHTPKQTQQHVVKHALGLTVLCCARLRPLTEGPTPEATTPIRHITCTFARSLCNFSLTNAGCKCSAAYGYDSYWHRQSWVCRYVWEHTVPGASLSRHITCTFRRTCTNPQLSIIVIVSNYWTPE